MIYTSYFNSKKYNMEKGVSIARSTPSLLVKNGLKEYKQLAPTMSMLLTYKAMCRAGNQEDAEDMYTNNFLKLLSKLDPSKVYNDLDGKVLLCYERPFEFCHRHLVAEWLIKNGYSVMEL
jgi:hypothetical protein